MATAPTYDAFQQVFALNTLANAVWMQTGTQQQLLSALTTAVNDTLSSSAAQAAIGGWSVAWGPQVWQNTGSDTADNAMFVAYNPSVTFPDGTTHDTYVVAIAATCPLSPYDWCVEDFTVDQVVDFASFNPLQGSPTPASPPFSPTQSLISMGTATGVSHLLQMTSPTGAPAAGQTLAAFLQGAKVTSKSVVVFTGHSLAGALSPTVALWLKKNQYLANFGIGRHYFYATAGATPGNTAFATECAINFVPTVNPPANSYKVWNRQVWNTLDVVPHAWGVALLSKVPTLYGNPELLPINFAVAGAVYDATKAKVAYVHPADQQLAGTINGTTPATTLEFLAQAAYQHTKAYGTLIAPSLTVVTSAADQSDAYVSALSAKLEAKAAAKQPEPAGA